MINRLFFIFGCLALVAVAYYFARLGRKAGHGRLPLNNITGIKTRAVMASGETWRYIHKRYRAIFYVDAVLFALSGIATGALAFIDPAKSEYRLSNRAVLAFMCLMLVFNVTMGAIATREARALNARRTG